MSVVMYLSFVVDILKLLLFSLWTYVEIIFGFVVAPSPKSLKDEIVLVTGGASGIGRELCLALAERELDLTMIIWDVDEEGVKGVVRELEELKVARVLGWKVDVGDVEQVRKGAVKIREEVGSVTLLFNNAGISGELKSAWLMDAERIERVLRVNLLGNCWTLKEFLPGMVLAGKGHVVAMCSLYGVLYGEEASPYCASKHAVKAYTECVKEDVRRLPGKPRIPFTLVFPFLIATPLTEQFQIRSTKYPFLTRHYDARDLAQRVVRGVLVDEEHIYFPAHFRLLPAFLAIFPSPIYRRVADFLSVAYHFRPKESK